MDPVSAFTKVLLPLDDGATEARFARGIFLVFERDDSEISALSAPNFQGSE